MTNNHMSTKTTQSGVWQTLYLWQENQTGQSTGLTTCTWTCGKAHCGNIVIALCLVWGLLTNGYTNTHFPCINCMQKCFPKHRHCLSKIIHIFRGSTNTPDFPNYVRVLPLSSATVKNWWSCLHCLAWWQQNQYRWSALRRQVMDSVE